MSDNPHTSDPHTVTPLGAPDVQPYPAGPPVAASPAAVAANPAAYSFPATSPIPATPAALQYFGVGAIGKDRSPASVLGLSIITLGVYYIAWYGLINGEMRRHDPDIKVRPALSVLALFVPIANIVSAYSTAARIRQMQLDDGAHTTISPVVALLLVMFLGLGYPLYVSSQLREHWHGHRRQARLA